MKISEHDIESKVVAYARSKGVLVVKQTHQGARSHPDRAFYFSGGRLLQIEFKAPGKLPTPLQAVTIKKLIGLEFNVAIIDNEDIGIQMIDDYFYYKSRGLNKDTLSESVAMCDKVLTKERIKKIEARPGTGR